MAKRIPNPSERLLRINHRELLSTAVGVTAASLVLDVPPSELAHAASAETAAWEGPTFSARSFLEITRRNQLRHEAKLPLLKVSKEWRRMKAAENVRRYSETFGKFVGENSEAVWVEVLAPIRKQMAIRIGNRNVAAKASDIRAKYTEFCGSDLRRSGKAVTRLLPAIYRIRERVGGDSAISLCRCICWCPTFVLQIATTRNVVFPYA